MTDKDALQRFIFEKAPVRGEFIHLEHSFQTITEQHPYPEPIKRLLGEALAAAGLLSAIIKFDGRLTVQFRGSGRLKLLLAQCNNNFHLRGLAKYEGNFTYEELMQSFNEGVLMIMLDSGLKNRYQGIVNWRGNSLAESIEGYFEHSEQLATKIWLNVSEKSAAGLLLQVVPTKDVGVGIEKEVITPSWEHAIQLTSKLNPDDMLTMDYPSLIQKLYPEEEIRVFPAMPVIFNCTCSRKRGEDAIRVMGRHEVDEELRDKNSISVTCDFCNKEYLFDADDIEKIFTDPGTPPSNIQIH